MNKAELSGVCRQMRRDIINMTANAGSGHPGGSLSAVELLTSVFYTQMRVDPKDPDWEDRDRFVLSKGHAAPCYYAVLAAMGFISYNGMTAEQFVWAWLRSELIEPKQIKFEPVNIYYEALKDTIDAKEKEVYKGND